MSETTLQTPANPKPPEAPVAQTSKIETPKAPTPPSTKTPELSLVDKVAIKIKKIRAYQLGVDLVDEVAVPRFKGKTGMNPFMYLSQVVDPIEKHINTAFEKDEKPDETLLNNFLTKVPDEVKPEIDKMNLNVKSLRQFMAEFNERNTKK